MRSTERKQIKQTKEALVAARLMRRRRKLTLRIAAVLFAAMLLCAMILIDVFLFPVEYLWAAVLTPEIEDRKDGQMRVFYLDVGQGDCTLVQLPDGQTLMIDRGIGETEGIRNILGVCVALGVQKIDHLFITHADADHIGGMETVLRCFGTDTVYLPAEDPEQGRIAQYRELAQKYCKNVCDTSMLTSMISEEEENFWYAMVLGGFPDTEKEGNDTSAILYLEYADRKLLFPGDVSYRVERELVSIYEQTGGIVFEVPMQTSYGTVLLSPNISSLDFLKVGHHGSADATCMEFAEYLHPQNVFVSCGAGNSYNHPSQEVIENLLQADASAQFYRTDELGNILLTIERDGRYSVLSV